MRFNDRTHPALEVTLNEDASFYKPMEVFLQELSRENVAMDLDERKLLVSSAQQVVKYLLDDLCKRYPNHFGKIYGGIIPVGSYYDGVRVKEATEFDFNVVINLPFLDLVIDRNNEPDGFFKLRIEENAKSRSHLPDELLKHIKSWTKDKYLISQRLKSYMESITHHWRNIDLAPLKLPVAVTVTKSGPAVTLDLILESKHISIDLVPVIRVANPPPKAFRWGGNLKIEGDWYFVPKSYRYIGSNEDASWRPSFPLQERKFLARGRMKHVLRLVKRVRDTLRFDKICSYYIKTLFLWKIFDEDMNWKDQSLSYLFFKMLTILKKCLEQNTIPHFWCRANLLENINPNTTAQWARRLNTILRHLEIDIAEKKTATLREHLQSILNDPLNNVATPSSPSRPQQDSSNCTVY